MSDLLEAFVQHRSGHDRDGKWYSLGVYQPRSDCSAKVAYERHAEAWRAGAQLEYGRRVELRPAEMSERAAIGCGGLK